MTILCVSSVGLDVPSCSPDVRPADRGYLCEWCYDRVVRAYEAWPRFLTALHATEGRAVQGDNAGVRTRQIGHVNLPLTFLSIDECERHLRTLPDGARALDQWVSTYDGALDAIRFAHAAERAYRDHEVEERPTRIRRVRCNACHQLTLVRNPPTHQGAAITIPCSNCGHTIREGDTAISYKQTPDGWEQTREDAIDVVAEIETRRTHA